MNKRKNKKFELRPILILSIIMFGVLILTLTSCDPMKHVVISNQTGKVINVQISQDTTNQFTLGRKTQVEFDLTSSGDSSTITYLYGFGGFSKEDLSSFNSMISQIKIKTSEDSCEIEGDELKNYLPQKRLGLFSNSLKIKIKNCP